MNTTHVQGFWVGIDVAAEKFDAAVAPVPCTTKNWMRARCHSFALTAAGVKDFAAWVAREEGLCGGICAESTGQYSERLRRLMAEHGSLPALAIENPARIKGTARMLAAPGKTDAIDARVIAFYGAANQPKPRPEPPAARQELRAAVKARDSLLGHLQMLKNQLDTVLVEDVREVLGQAIDSLETALAAAEELVGNAIAEDAELARDAELLVSVPGIGPAIAAEILALFGDLRTWTRRQLIAHAGLVPLPYESGKSVRGRAHLSRRGGGKLRKKLYMPSTMMLKRDFAYNERVRERFKDGENGKVCACAAMRKVLLVARAVVISGEPFDPEKARRCTPLNGPAIVPDRSGG